MDESIKACAEMIWAIARDLASPRYSGTPLNADRNISHLASVIKQCARAYAADESLQCEVRRNEQMKSEVKELKAAVKQLKDSLKEATQ